MKIKANMLALEANQNKYNINILVYSQVKKKQRKSNEIQCIYRKVIKINKKIVLMQCNTNYTADKKNFLFINLKVLNKFKERISNEILVKGLMIINKSFYKTPQINDTVEVLFGLNDLNNGNIKKHYDNSVTPYPFIKSSIT